MELLYFSFNYFLALLLPEQMIDPFCVCYFLFYLYEKFPTILIFRIWPTIFDKYSTVWVISISSTGYLGLRKKASKTLSQFPGIYDKRIYTNCNTLCSQIKISLLTWCLDSIWIFITFIRQLVQKPTYVHVQSQDLRYIFLIKL